MANLGNYRVKFSHKEIIEPEEIFLDSQKLKREEGLDYELGRTELPIKRRNFLILLGLIFLGFLTIFIKIFMIQVKDYEIYIAQSQRNSTRTYPINPQRGVIYDRNFEQLVFNVPAFDLVVDRGSLKEKERILRELSNILKKPYEELYGAIEGSLEDYVFLAENLDHETILALESRMKEKEFEGIKIEKDFRRKYPVAAASSHILGFLRRVSPEDLKEKGDYYFTDFIGKSGIEQTYENILRGVPGRKRIERDVRGKIRKEEVLSLPQVGKSLLLHLNSGLQKKLYDELFKAAQGKPAAAVALDPQSGGILALVSLPSFDNNIFSRKISQEEFKKIDLLNRPIAGIYPTGSTIKPLLAAAALEEKIITSRKTVNCQGSIHIGSWEYKDWKAHGITNMIKAIAESCNVYFYSVGGGYGRQEGLGLERILKYLKLLGWGSVLGIDILGEKDGILPIKLYNPGDIYSISIGQGDIAVTPLQVANSFAAIANGGTLYQPQLVDKISDENKNIIEDIAPKIIRQNFISRENLEISRKGMREAVISGSAQLLNSLGVKAAGKTGTAQFGKGGLKKHAWFTVFAPYDNPEIVLTIIIEGGGEGSAAAVPAAKEVFEYYFSNKEE